MRLNGWTQALSGRPGATEPLRRSLPTRRASSEEFPLFGSRGGERRQLAERPAQIDLDLLHVAPNPAHLSLDPSRRGAQRLQTTEPLLDPAETLPEDVQVDLTRRRGDGE